MAKREPIKSPVVYLQHAEKVCPDCGRRGCLIPVSHKKAIAPDLRWMVGYYEA